MKRMLKYIAVIGVGMTANLGTAQASGDATEATMINPAGLYDPSVNGYSHGVMVKAGARTLYVAGQGGEDATGALSPVFEDQLAQAYRNLKQVLDTAGAKPSHVVKLTTYVVEYDQGKLPAMTLALKKVFGTALPAQTLVPVHRLALDGMLFEVDAIAVLPE